VTRQRSASPHTHDVWAGIAGAVSRRELKTIAPGDLDTARDLFGELPPIYEEWAQRFGALTTPDGKRRLLGILEPGAHRELDALYTARMLRALYRLPRHLIPIEMLPDNQVNCVLSNNQRAPVVMIDLDDVSSGHVRVAPSLEEFTYEWRADLLSIRGALTHLKRKREAIAAGRRAADQLDRPGEWSLTRLCSEDVVLAVLRTRHNRQHNRQDMAIFATTTLTSHAPGAPIRVALTALLSDAYLAGGSLAVEFGASDQGDGPIPGPLRRWAFQRKVQLPRRGGWDAATGETLYALAANLTPSTPELLKRRGVATGVACFAVASGALSPLALEAVLRWSPNPKRLLAGGGTGRLDYLADQQALRSAILLTSVVRRLENRSLTSDDDDVPARLRVEFGGVAPQGMDVSVSAIRLVAPEGITTRLEWRALAGEETDRSELMIHLLAVEDDLLASQLAAALPSVDAGSVVVVPADALTNRDVALTSALADATERGVVVVACPDYTTTLDASADRFLQRAATART
jgi:hypothetical protein